MSALKARRPNRSGHAGQLRQAGKVNGLRTISDNGSGVSSLLRKPCLAKEMSGRLAVGGQVSSRDISGGGGGGEASGWGGQRFSRVTQPLKDAMPRYVAKVQCRGVCTWQPFCLTAPGTVTRRRRGAMRCSQARVMTSDVVAARGGPRCPTADCRCWDGSSIGRALDRQWSWREASSPIQTGVTWRLDALASRRCCGVWTLDALSLSPMKLR